MRRVLPALVLLVLLAPTAQAGAPLAGEVTWGDDASIEGDAVVRATGGFLNLSRAAEGARFTWASAGGTLWQGEGYRGPTDHEVRDPKPQPISWSAGSLTLSSCDACWVVAWTETDGAVGLSGAADGPLARTDGARDEQAAGPAVRLRYRLPETWLEAPLAPDATPLAEGRVFLYVFGAVARVEQGGASEDVWTGTRTEPAAVAGVPVHRTRSAELILELENATLTGPPGARLIAGTLDVALTGTAHAPAATGWISVDGRRHDLQGDPLTLEGALTLAATPRPRGGGDARLGGEVDRVVIAGDTVASAPPAAVVAAPAAVGAGALALFLAWRFLVPLYSRLTRGNVLLNPNRQHVYDAILASPGAHVAALSRATGVSRVVLQHHLRILEAHHLVVARDVGRLSTWFPTGLAPQNEDLAADAALRDLTRRRVARMVVESAGLTQKEVAERTAISQRLASYHLSQLETAGLLAREGWRPARFVATSRLRARLGGAEAEGVSPDT